MLASATHIPSAGPKSFLFQSRQTNVLVPEKNILLLLHVNFFQFDSLYLPRYISAIDISIDR